MGNLKSNLTATITAVDVNSKQPITRDIGSPSLDGAFGEFTSYMNLAVAAADVAIGLPQIPCYCVYVKNLQAAGGGLLTIKVTPSGGAEAIVTILDGGGVFLVWNATNTIGSAGITTLKLNPSAANTKIEFYVGG